MSDTQAPGGRPGFGKSLVMLIVFFAINVIKLPPYAALGLFTKETLLFGLILAPAAVAGTWIGIWAHRRVPERAFFMLTYVLLVLTGIRLIWTGWRRLRGT